MAGDEALDPAVKPRDDRWGRVGSEGRAEALDYAAAWPDGSQAGACSYRVGKGPVSGQG